MYLGMYKAALMMESKLCLALAQNVPKLRSLRFVDYAIICFVLIAHRNQYLMSLCHLMTYIRKKSIKYTTEQRSLKKQGCKLCLVLAQNVPKLRSLCFLGYVINKYNPSVMFRLNCLRNQYLMSLCHLMTYITENDIKNTTEQCSLAKQAMFGSCAIKMSLN